MSAEAMRQCLEALDIPRLRKLWGEVSPHLPQPTDEIGFLTAMHMARTMSAVVGFKFRAYSHAWLLERGYPSGLPDELKPRAQQLHPVTVGVVGVSVRSSYPLVVKEVGGAMVDVVENAYADGKTDPGYVKPRMLDARDRAKKRLFG